MVVPIGFVSDHMEVVFDLDTEAAATAEECGLASACQQRRRSSGVRERARRPDGGACRGGPRRIPERPIVGSAPSAV